MEQKTLQKRYQTIAVHLDERARRLWLANEAIAFGRGGISLVARETGTSRTTITEGVKEINGIKPLPGTRIRRPGAGRRKAEKTDSALVSDVQTYVDSSTLGDPEQDIVWTSKSTRNIAHELNRKKHRASHSLVSRILEGLGYSLQANRKTMEGTIKHPDRNAQFEFINAKAKGFHERGCPVISVDTKKKENVGNFKNHGREYHAKGKPAEVNVYDFLDKEKGKASPYGVYDLARNKGWVSVGISADTAQFAVHSILSWWKQIGKARYPNTKDVLITADCGGSNGYRVRLWKTELQKFATQTGITVHVCHFPPGTSKWNKIEHRLFSFISKNWRGKPLINLATIVSLIGATKTKNGLTVTARLDTNQYEKGIKVSDKDLASVKLERDPFHGEWNYRISP
jgi:hypothetical protein